MRHSEVAFMDLFKECIPPVQNNMLIAIGVPAILIYVPLIVVGVPAGIIAFLVAGGTALLTRGSDAQTGAAMLAVMPIAVIAAIAFAVVYNVIRVGWTNVMLKMLRGQTATFGDLAESMPWFVNFLITMVIIGLGTALGTLLFIVPGILIAIRTSMAPFLVVDRNMTPVAALIRSNELVTGYSWQILGYFILYGIANAVATNIPIIQFVSGPAAMGYFDLVLARIYLMRQDSR